MLIAAALLSAASLTAEPLWLQLPWTAVLSAGGSPPYSPRRRAVTRRRRAPRGCSAST